MVVLHRRHRLGLRSLGLPAVAVYALAYTAEFGTSLVTYFGGEAGT